MDEIEYALIDENPLTDHYLSWIYSYYQGGGYRRILVQRICNLIVLTFLVTFTFIILLCIDWHNLLKDADTGEIIPQEIKTIKS